MDNSNNHEEQQYLNLVKNLLKQKEDPLNFSDNRTGVRTLSDVGHIMKFSLIDGTFPLITTKKIFFKGVVEELLWMIKGNTNSNTLSEKGVKIWDQNGSRAFLDKVGLTNREEGDLGPIYGFQWRHFGAHYETMNNNYDKKGFDQLLHCINLIKKDPNNRRIIMTTWNPIDIPKMALPPCHILCQFFVKNGKLSSLMYQRSCDLGLGVPFNIASYALLTIIIASICDIEPGQFIHVLGDYHIYENHINALETQISRTPKPFPKLKILNKKSNIDSFQYEDFLLIDYKSHDPIKMDMAL